MLRERKARTAAIDRTLKDPLALQSAAVPVLEHLQMSACYVAPVSAC